MKMLQINDQLPQVSAIGLGCMRLTGLQDDKAAAALVDACLEEGINFFDHADIYAGGGGGSFSAVEEGREAEKLWCEQPQSHADQVVKQLSG